MTTVQPDNLSYRGDGSGRPGVVPVPVSTAPTWRGSRLRKHWRYVGVWGPDISLCAARVHVGSLTQEFWAIWLRSAGVLRQRTRLRSGRVAAGDDGRLRVHDGAVAIDLKLQLSERSAVEVVTPVGPDWTWTRKVAARAVGTVRVDGHAHAVDAPAMVDDNGGYHPRHTRWRWAAGAGTLTDGRRVMWNQVVGLNDILPHTENTVWIDGDPQPTGRVRISPDLTTTRFDDGNALHFACEADRSHATNLIVLRSNYRAPFGTFDGTLPGGLELADGYGVMEDHRALW